ncbi:MAG: hypothetical protein KA341_14340 [Saprospiraceae bacterium]|nr:hypothetical protein [Saprospiraceae bacterium]
MTADNKIILDKTIDFENEETPFGTRYGGDVFVITEEDIENLKNGKIIALDVQNEYITYLKFKTK